MDCIGVVYEGNGACVILIPSNQLAKPDDYIFIDNEQSEHFSHLSNWEIKVFVKGIPELSKFALNNVVGQL